MAIEARSASEVRPYVASLTRRRVPRRASITLGRAQYNSNFLYLLIRGRRQAGIPIRRRRLSIRHKTSTRNDLRLRKLLALRRRTFVVSGNFQVVEQNSVYVGFCPDRETRSRAAPQTYSVRIGRKLRTSIFLAPRLRSHLSAHPTGRTAPRQVRKQNHNRLPPSAHNHGRSTRTNRAMPLARRRCVRYDPSLSGFLPESPFA